MLWSEFVLPFARFLQRRSCASELLVAPQTQNVRTSAVVDFICKFHFISKLLLRRLQRVSKGKLERIKVEQVAITVAVHVGCLAAY